MFCQQTAPKYLCCGRQFHLRPAPLNVKADTSSRTAWGKHATPHSSQPASTGPHSCGIYVHVLHVLIIMLLLFCAPDHVWCSMPNSSQMPRTHWTERLTAPFKFGGQELLPSAVKLGSAVTLTAVMRRAAAQLGRQLLGHHVRYQVCGPRLRAASQDSGIAA